MKPFIEMQLCQLLMRTSWSPRYYFTFRLNSSMVLHLKLKIPSNKSHRDCKNMKSKASSSKNITITYLSYWSEKKKSQSKDFI